jgi:putative ABC transport system permease protein
VRLPPAEAMRPPAPGVYRPMLIERLGIQQWFSPAVRMVLRTMERRLLRTSLTVFGIAVAMAIVITGAFWRDSIAVLLDTQFHQVLRGDVSIGLLEATPARVGHSLAKLPHVTAVELMRSAPVRLVHGHRSWRGTLQGKPEQPQLHRIAGLQGEVYSPPVSGVLLTDRLAERLQVQPGDLIRLEFLEGRRESFELAVTGTVAEMMGMNVYMERHAANRLLREGDIVNQATVSVERGFESDLLNVMKELPVVSAAVSKAVMRRNIEEVTARNVMVFSAILSGFAVVIATGVVYNNARIALAERSWELASLRVLGFTRGEVSGFLLGELALEILLATPLGMLLGYLLASTIVHLIRNDEFYFPIAIRPATYAFAIVCVLAAGIVSALIVRRRIDTLDLVAVLKTRE